ncbi:hypothetical protein FUT89_27075, partial [Ralstonia pseudosolanacearum]
MTTASDQVVPPSRLTCTVSPVPSAALTVPLRVGAVSPVIQSPVVPVSAVSVVRVAVVVGATVSTVRVNAVVAVLTLPAASVAVAVRLWL